MKTSFVILPALAALIVSGCSKRDAIPSAQPAGQAAAGRAESLELTPELAATMTLRGKGVAAETFSLLSSNLQTAMASGGVTNALPFCSLTASPLTASIADKHGVKLRRVTHKARVPKDKTNPEESAVLDRFRSSLESGVTPSPWVTNLQPGVVTFFAPIIITNALCLKCHGQPGQDIAPDALAVIRKLYPQDEATGFKLGDLRGAWRIDFPAAAVNRLGSDPTP